MRSLIFVYGSLLSGFHNNHLLDWSLFVDDGAMPGKWGMADFCGFPGVFHAEEHKTIIGELWSVGDKTMKLLDGLEGHPHSYKRDMYPIMQENGTATLAWAYIFQGSTDGYPLVNDNDWRAHKPQMLKAKP